MSTVQHQKYTLRRYPHFMSQVYLSKYPNRVTHKDICIDYSYAILMSRMLHVIFLCFATLFIDWNKLDCKINQFVIRLYNFEWKLIVEKCHFPSIIYVPVYAVYPTFILCPRGALKQITRSSAVYSNFHPYGHRQSIRSIYEVVQKNYWFVRNGE